MQTIRLTETENKAILDPQTGNAQNTGSGNPAPGTAPAATKGVLSDQDALKGTEHTKIATLTPLTGGQVPPIGSGQSVSVGGMVDGKLAVELIDSLIPALLVVLIAKVGLIMKKTDLQMTAKEKDTMAPIVQKCMDQLMINFNNPWAALGITYGIIMSGKILEKGGPAFLERKADKAKEAVQNKVTETKVVEKNAEKEKEVKSELFNEAMKKRQDQARIEIDGYVPTDTEIKIMVYKQKISRKLANERLINLNRIKVNKKYGL